MLKMAIKHLFRREVEAIKDIDDNSSSAIYSNFIAGVMSGEVLIPTGGKILLKSVNIMDSLSPKNSLRNRLKMRVLASKVKASEVKDVSRRAFMNLMVLEAMK